MQCMDVTEYRIMDVEQVSQWLEANGLQQYCAAFIGKYSKHIISCSYFRKSYL